MALKVIRRINLSGGSKSYPTDWKVIRQIGILSDRLESYPTDWKVIRRIKKLSDGLKSYPTDKNFVKSYPTDRKVIRQIGELSDRLKSYPADWKVFRQIEKLSDGLKSYPTDSFWAIRRIIFINKIRRIKVSGNGPKGACGQFRVDFGYVWASSGKYSLLSIISVIKTVI